MIGISWRRITKMFKRRGKKLPLCGMTGSQQEFTRKKMQNNIALYNYTKMVIYFYIKKICCCYVL